MRQSALDRLHASINARDAEMVTITQMSAPGYTVGAPTGVTADVWAVRVLANARVRGSSDHPRSGHNVELAVSSDTAKFTTSDVPFTVKAGDQLTPKDAGHPVYHIVTVLDLGVDRTLVTLMTLSA